MNNIVGPEVRLAQAMTTGRSQAWLAKEVGVAASTINGYLKGKVPPVDVAFAMCKVLGISIHWYIEGTSAPLNAVSNEGSTNIPIIDSVGHALPFPNSLLSAFNVGIESFLCITVSGTMMTPHIPEGAEVLATKLFGQVEDGRVYILKIKDTTVLRRVKIGSDSRLLAICENPAVKNDVPDIINAKDIIALALWSSHSL